MNNIYYNLTSITENTVVKADEIVFKGHPTVQFVLTGIDESFNKVLSIELNWGDSTGIEAYAKDIIFNYREKSIFNEILYNKPGGSICIYYNHTYNPPVSATVTSLTAQTILYFSNGVYANILQPLKLVKESYYDAIKEFNILNTQIQSLSSRTIVNLESESNKTFIALLE